MKDKNTANTPITETTQFEHERRFFPDLKNFLFDQTLYPKKEIVQGYLEDEFHTRIREECDSEWNYKFWQTRKTGEGVSRLEDEQLISRNEFGHMWEYIVCSLSKTRYFVDCGNYIAEVNVFHGNLAGYVQIEVEFKTHDEAVAFVPPSWFGIEVTDDKRHGNYYLAKNGCKDLLV